MLCFQDGTCWVSLLRSPSLPVHTRLPLTSHCSWPSALTALPPPLCSHRCHLVSPQEPLSCCCAFQGHPLRPPSPPRASATLGRGQQSFFGWRLLGSVCRRAACLALIGATGNLWAPIAVGCAVLLAILSPVPHQLFLPLSLAVPLDLCHSH